MAGSILSLRIPRRHSSPSSSSQNDMFHVVLFRKWGGLVILFLLSVWWTAQLIIHTTISSEFHLRNNNNMHIQQSGAAAAAAAAASPVQVAGSSLPLLKQSDEVGEKEQQVKQILHGEDNQRSSTDDESSQETQPSLRKIFEETHNPNDWERIRNVVERLRVPMPTTPTLDIAYDIFHCPTDAPPIDYPYHWPLRKILAHWNPANVNMPALIHQSLCVFDWDRDYHAIVKYRQAEVPFIVENHPELMKASERWMSGQMHLQNNDAAVTSANAAAAAVASNNNNNNNRTTSYLERLIGTQKQPAEHSDSNKFIYWKHTKQTRHNVTWKPPVEDIELSYRDWYRRAMDLDQKTKAAAAASSSSSSSSKNSSISQASFDHWYFHVNAKKEENQFLYDELPIFKPDNDDENEEDDDSSKEKNVFMVEPEHARGINCRFGMRGVLAAAHYDSQPNWVVIMGGQRRYILSHPRECAHLHLYPPGHPSARHSSVDWTNVTNPCDGDDSGETILQDAMASEVVLQAAHALYLPSFWFHFIVSLNINYQCNARSGRSYIDSDHIATCGFKVPSYEEEL